MGPMRYEKSAKAVGDPKKWSDILTAIGQMMSIVLWHHVMLRWPDAWNSHSLSQCKPPWTVQVNDKWFLISIMCAYARARRVV